MLARHSTPIETSSPELVFRPLWQASHRSDVRKKVPGGVLSPFAFSVRDWQSSIAGTPATASPRTTALLQWSLIRSLIANLPITSHPPGPRAYRTAPAAFAPG